MKRILARPVHKKAPFTIEMMQAIIADTEQNDSLSNVSLATMRLLAFAGFLGFDVLSNICLCHLHFEGDHVKLFILKSKTNQLCEDNKVLLARPSSATYLVAML